MDDLEFFNVLANLRAEMANMNRQLDLIRRSLTVVQSQEALEMATIDEVIAKVEAQAGVVASIETLVTELRAAAQAAGIPQEKVDAVFAGVEANTERLAAALVAPGTT